MILGAGAAQVELAISTTRSRFRAWFEQLASAYQGGGRGPHLPALAHYSRDAIGFTADRPGLTGKIWPVTSQTDDGSRPAVALSGSERTYRCGMLNFRHRPRRNHCTVRP